MDFIKLHADSHELLERLADRVPPAWLGPYRNLSRSGEWPTLINELAACLVHERIPIDAAERDALADLLNRFPLPMDGLDYITHRDQTLAALTLRQ